MIQLHFHTVINFTEEQVENIVNILDECYTCESKSIYITIYKWYSDRSSDTFKHKHVKALMMTFSSSCQECFRESKSIMRSRVFDRENFFNELSVFLVDTL